MKNKINNLAELRAEIVRLKLVRKEQEDYLGDQYNLVEYKLETPMRIFRSITSWIPRKLSDIGLSGAEGQLHEDWVTKSLRVGLPYLLNKFVFRRAGIVKKLLVALLSQQAASVINKDSVASIVDRFTAFIKPDKKKSTATKDDYGIPPDSETY